MILTGLPWLYPTGMKLYTPVLPVTNPVLGTLYDRKELPEKRTDSNKRPRNSTPSLSCNIYYACLYIHSMYTYTTVTNLTEQRSTHWNPFHGAETGNSAHRIQTVIQRCAKGWDIDPLLVAPFSIVANHWRITGNADIILSNMSKVHSSCNCFVILRFVLCMTFTLGYVGSLSFIGGIHTVEIKVV